MLDEIEAQSGNRTPYLARAVRAFIDGRHADGVAALLAQVTSGTIDDPEMFFYVARHLAHVGDVDRAMPLLARARDTGYLNYPVIAGDPWLAAARARPDGQTLLDDVRSRWQRAAASFAAAGGPALLKTADSS
jgi:hypothetical protein